MSRAMIIGICVVLGAVVGVAIGDILNVEHLTGAILAGLGAALGVFVGNLIISGKYPPPNSL